MNEDAELNLQQEVRQLRARMSLQESDWRCIAAALDEVWRRLQREAFNEQRGLSPQAVLVWNLMRRLQGREPL